MRNETLIKNTRDLLKESLAKCDDKQQLMFKRMYSHQNLDISINDAVDNMPSDKLEWALSQVERTLAKANS